jgi:hypothetical protein
MDLTTILVVALCVLVVALTLTACAVMIKRAKDE